MIPRELAARPPLVRENRSKPGQSSTSPLRLATAEVVEAVLELNRTHATELSDLDGGDLTRLIDSAFHASVVDDGVAFILAFDQDARYDSPNFKWFRSRYDRFVYVDRVAVAARARGRGMARLLYDHLITDAFGSGHSLITCEINVAPPNPASDALHAALGFEEVGCADLSSSKTVRYMLKRR